MPTSMGKYEELLYDSVTRGTTIYNAKDLFEGDSKPEGCKYFEEVVTRVVLSTRGHYAV